MQDRRILLLAPATAFLVAVFLVPIAGVLGRSLFDPGFTLRHYATIATSDAIPAVFINTFRLAFLVTVTTALIGYLVAWALCRMRGLLGTVMLGAIILPLWISDLVRTFSWTIVLGRRGPLNEALLHLGVIDRPLQLLFNETAVLIGTVHIFLPFMVLPLYASMKAADPRLERAALSLGASPFTAFRTVFFPLTLPGLIAGILLVYVLAIGMYVTPAALGSPSETMIAMLIETQGRRLLNWGLATALATVLLVAVLATLVIAHRVARLNRMVAGGRFA